MDNYRNLLTDLGFAPADHKKDFGDIIPYVDYSYRKLPNGSFQYVSLISYEGKFCEAVYEIYKGEKNTRDKKQTGDKYLYRDYDKLKERIESNK